jgi:hypothetical protein
MQRWRSMSGKCANQHHRNYSAESPRFATAEEGRRTYILCDLVPAPS